VDVGGRAVAFVGAACAGKSTVAATFALLGHRVLSDDIVAIAMKDDLAFAIPAYAQLRLWPESVALLFGTSDALPQLTPTWDKRGFDLAQARAFQDQPLPLAAIYALDDRTAEASPRTEALGGRESLLTLLGNGYVSYLMDQMQRRQEFETLARVVSQVPVRRLSVPNPARHAAELRQRILEDCGST
jgi:hypothetical protein